MITCFLVDDHSVFRAGVRAELAKAADIEIVGEAGTVAEAIAGIHASTPHVVLLDVHMPDGGGITVLRTIRETTGATGPQFLALSVSDAAEDVISLIRAGARGYVTKSIGGEELADAVRRVHDNDAVFSPRLAGFVLDAFSKPEQPTAGTGAGVDTDAEAESLTRREREVLRLLARGYTYKEIAAELFISIKTVETHASNILRKTQTSNRHALTRWAQTHDLD